MYRNVHGCVQEGSQEVVRLVQRQVEQNGNIHNDAEYSEWTRQFQVVRLEKRIDWTLPMHIHKKPLTTENFYCYVCQSKRQFHVSIWNYFSQWCAFKVILMFCFFKKIRWYLLNIYKSRIIHLVLLLYKMLLLSN